MSVETFNKKYERFLNKVYDRINKRFSTNKGKNLTDSLIEIAEPFLPDFIIKEFLNDFIIKRLDISCEELNLTTLEEFTPEAIGFTRKFAKTLPFFMDMKNVSEQDF